MTTLTLPTVDRRIASALLLASVFSVCLLLLRFLLTNRLTYLFLIWNLFLAWIPLIFAWMVVHASKPAVAWKIIWLPAFLWLLFFPNSPYILTDLGHLARMNEWATFPLGYDVVMLLAFTLNGLLLGFVSLFIMESVWRQHLRTRVATAFSLVALFLTGVGMYLGRFLRWNSWDLFHQPGLLFRDLAIRITHPADHPNIWAFTALYSSFLIVIYLVIRLWQPAVKEKG